MSKSLLTATAFNAYVGILAGMGIGPTMEGITPAHGDGFIGHHSATAFNASAFAGANFHAALTAFAARQTDPEQANLEAHSRYLAPEVFAGDGIAEWGTGLNIDSFFAQDNTNGDLRAIGADFTTVQDAKTGIAEQRIPNRGIAVDIDEDKYPRGTNWQQLAVTRLQGILARNRIRRIVALYVAGGAAVSLTWDTGNGADPDMDLLDQLNIAAGIIGFKPNRIAMDPTAWSYRVAAHRAENTAGSNSSSQMTPDQLGRYLSCEVREIAARYATGAATRGALVGTGKVLIFPAQDSPSLEDISSVKTFWRDCEGGGRQRVLVRQVGDKKWRVAVECHETQTVLSTSGVRVLTIANA